MRNAVNQFSHLGIYKALSTPAIVNLMVCNRVMKSKPIVANANRLYKISRTILGSPIVDTIIQKTFCKALTAGNSLQQAQEVSKMFRDQDISIILDYCAQGVMGNKDSEVVLDQSAKLFAKSAEALSHQNHEMISIKITGLVDMKLLKSMNDSVLLRNKFWEQNSENGMLTGQKAFQGLQKIWNGVSDQDFETYLKEIHQYEGSPHEWKIDEVDFKMRHHPFYVQKQAKNKNSIIRLFFPLDEASTQKMKNFVSRLDLICHPYSNNKNGFKILVDAEQSYVQRAIECISQQLQERYNKKQLYIIPTIQNYLKISVARSEYEVEIAKRKNLIFGAKLVRGAYLVQESHLADKNGTENPIVDCFEKTTENYLKSFEIMIKNFNDGEVVVATHNIDTVYQTQRIFSDSGSNIRVSYAQLLGLADHLTFKAKEDNFRVYKYLPWAKVDVMIPYMIRRAQELSQMKYPLDAQFDLLAHELKSRFKF